MTIVIAGGTGLIGGRLTEYLVRQDHTVIILTRSATQRRNGVRFVQWDGKTQGTWSRAIDGADVVVNLAGRSVFTRWTDEAKQAILASRLEPTGALVEAMAAAEQKPSLFISISGVGYYGDTGSEPVTEEHPPGQDFLASVCSRWEKTARRAEDVGVRTVTPRMGVVLDPRGGALQPMLTAFRLFAGGPVGSGNQYFPWVHSHDAVRALTFPMENTGLSGPCNVVAPEPTTMRDFTEAVGEAVNRPSWFPVPEFAVRLVLGEAGDMLLTGQRALPAALLGAGFGFQFSTAAHALRDLLSRD